MTFSQIREIGAGEKVILEDGLPFLFALVSGGSDGGTLDASPDGQAWVTIATAVANSTAYVNGVYPVRHLRTTGSAVAIISAMGVRT
ncbi:MAG: hypothetical protein QXS54_11520 [Candidatus Methanomethylicaceae archaeon]